MLSSRLGAREFSSRFWASNAPVCFCFASRVLSRGFAPAPQTAMTQAAVREGVGCLSRGACLLDHRPGLPRRLSKSVPPGRENRRLERRYFSRGRKQEVYIQRLYKILCKPLKLQKKKILSRNVTDNYRVSQGRLSFNYRLQECIHNVYTKGCIPAPWMYSQRISNVYTPAGYRSEGVTYCSMYGCGGYPLG